MNTHIETLVIGAGQAGLSTAYHLTRHDRACLVLDANHRVGENWRQQWDSLRLYTPAKYDGLPGMPFPAPRWHYPTKDEVADYLAAYAERFELPLQLGTRVQHLGSNGGGFTVSTDNGRYEADNVVVATGTFGRTPSIPEFAVDLDPAIMQLHSSAYRRPAQLQDGPILVVGASHSGFDVAYEAAQTHQTILAGRDCGQNPLRIEGRGIRVAFPIMWFLAGHVLSRGTPVGRKVMSEIRFHGGPALRVKRADLANRGVERITERVVGVESGKPVLAGGRVLDVANVVWATGFRHAFDWIDLPVFTEEGWPKEERGVVEDVRGLYFCGLSFQHSFRSMLVGGAGADADYVVRRILARSPERANA